MAAPIRNSAFALRRLIQRCQTIRSTSYSTAPSNEGTLRDPLPIFMQDDVQRLLTSMTGFDLLRLAGPLKGPLKKPHYKLLTDEELERVTKRAEKRLKHRLQMPPFMKAREPIQEVLSVDPELQGLEENKIIFTDITFGLKDRQRYMAVREPDGTLRKASWDERDRVNQIYSPLEGRHFQMPAMFEEANLETLLKNKTFLYVLDLACVQFEPDNPDYIRVTHRTYESIDASQSFEDLRSTRHFGGFAFYCAWYQKIDNLLIDMINRDLLSDTGDLINLYCIVNPKSPVAKQLSADTSDIVKMLKLFCSSEARHKGPLELAIQSLEDRLQPKAAAKS